MTPSVTFASLQATSLLPFCLPHFTPLHFASCSLCITSPHFVPLCFASPPFPCLTSCHFASPPIFSHSLHLISRHFTSFPLLSTFTSLHFVLPPVFSHSLHLISHHFTSPPIFPPHFTPLHATSLRLILSASLCATSRHLTPPPVIFTSLHTTSRQLPFCLPHFVPLHATSRHLPFFLPHFMPLHSNSLHLPSFRLTSHHLTSSHPSACFASLATLHQKST